jgi:hypothetical protein
MSLNLSNLTEAAQKKISELSNKISIQKKLIEREQDVLRNKGETYVCTRARNASQLRKDKLVNLNSQCDSECDEITRKTQSKIKSLTEEYEQKCKELQDKCKMNISSVEAHYASREMVLEREIEIQEKIIWDETHRENPTIIRANTEIRMLKEEKDKILKAAGVFDTVKPPAKQFVNEYIAPVEEKEKHDETSDVDFAMFMLDGRQDGKPIDPNPSWLNGVAHGLCMNSKEKKKGIKMP